jgi:penicillin-binding protein A
LLILASFGLGLMLLLPAFASAPPAPSEVEGKPDAELTTGPVQTDATKIASTTEASERVTPRRTPDPRRAVPEAAARSLFEQVLRVADAEARDEFQGVLHIDDIASADFVREANRLVVTREGTQYALSFDAKLQTKLSAWLKKKNPLRGAFVALDPRDGRVLALVEHARPSAGVVHPALSAKPPSASIFKIFTSLALFTKRPKHDAAAKVCYHGGFRGLRKGNIVDNKRRDTACVTLTRAFAKSANAVFAKMAYRHLDLKDYQTLGERLGYDEGGSVLPFPFDYEAGDFTLSEAPLERAKQAAGFWSSHLSPVQGALLAAVLANDGVLKTPWLVDEVAHDGVQRYKAGEAEALRVLDAEPVRAVKALMSETGTKGTGRKYIGASRRLRKIGVPCKSGTLSGYKGDKTRYTWFVGFAPAENPTIAFAAMVGNDDKWTVKAGHLMRHALETYFRDEKQALKGHTRPVI